MLSENHNYILDSGVVHANSHAVSYAGVIAFRSLFYKAHFFPEWIASVLNDCNSKKIPRYISMIRSEGWKPTDITNLGRKPEEKFSKFEIIALEINNLKPNYSAIGNVLSVGLLSVKGLGESSKPICDIVGPFDSIDDFISKTNAGKTVVEPLIRLGAFDRIDSHLNRKALWTYYVYRHKKMSTTDKNSVVKYMTEKTGWTELDIITEIDRQKDAYRNMYPNRNVIPKKILNWKPDVNFTLEQFNEHVAEYKISEKIAFEELYLGYNLSNPMLMYETKHNRTIDECANECVQIGYSFLECIISECEVSSTSNDSKYCRLNVTDGTNSTTIFIWSNILEKLPQALLRKGKAIMAPVAYDSVRKSFTILKGHTIIPLNKKD